MTHPPSQQSDWELQFPIILLGFQELLQLGTRCRNGGTLKNGGFLAPTLMTAALGARCSDRGNRAEASPTLMTTAAMVCPLPAD